MHVGGLFDLVWVRVAYFVLKFGLNGLWVAVTAFVKMSTRAVIVRASLSACAPQMVHAASCCGSHSYLSNCA